VRSIQPLLRGYFNDPPDLVITGKGADRLRLDDRSDGITVEEGTADLDPFYERARVFVAPSRFAAGIPLKIIEAAARGVPVVCSSLLAHQLDWQHERDVLTADTPDGYAEAIARLFSNEALWSRIRGNALQRVSAEHSRATFDRSVRTVLDCVNDGATPRPDRRRAEPGGQET
jgi:glycosyltransferase involved in cell wall biosynthesis